MMGVLHLVMIPLSFCLPFCYAERFDDIHQVYREGADCVSSVVHILTIVRACFIERSYVVGQACLRGEHKAMSVSRLHCWSA